MTFTESEVNWLAFGQRASKWQIWDRKAYISAFKGCSSFHNAKLLSTEWNYICFLEEKIKTKRGGKGQTCLSCTKKIIQLYSDQSSAVLAAKKSKESLDCLKSTFKFFPGLISNQQRKRKGRRWERWLNGRSGEKTKPAPRPLLYRVSTNCLSSRKGFSSVSNFQGNKVKRKELIFRGEELMLKPRI